MNINMNIKPGPASSSWVQSSHRPIPVFSQIFPLRLRYSAGLRSFSTRRASKSLIEDEAELSDWVSELRSDSFRGKLTSEDEASSDVVDRARNRTRGREIRDRDNKGSTSVRDSFSNKKPRIRETSEPTQNRSDSFSRNSRATRRFGSALEDERTTGNNGGSRNANVMGRRGGREMDKGYVRNGGNRGSSDGIRGNRGSSDGIRGNRGSSDGIRKGGVKDSTATKLPRWMDDDDVDEDEEKLMPAIGDLLSEEDSDAEDDDDDDGELLKKNVSSMFGLAKEEVSVKVSPRTSSTESESLSYLSQTRYVFKKNAIFVTIYFLRLFILCVYVLVMS